MIRTIHHDIKRTIFLECASTSSFAQKLFILFFAYGLHALVIFRIGKAIRSSLLHWWSAPLYYPCICFYEMLRFASEKLYGIYIDPLAEIGDGFYIGHFGDIRIGSCIIGKDCSIHQMASIGIYPDDGSHLKTVLGDNVWIGGHANVHKGVTIGSGATIVVCSEVVSDVKPGLMVMGKPARTIKKSFSNASLMGF